MASGTGEHSFASAQTSSADPAINTESTRKGRGPTRGVGTERLVNLSGKLTINFSTREERPVCDNASKLANECGTIVRLFAPLQVLKWSQVSEQDKLALIERVEDKFEIDTSVPYIKKFINKSMASKYTNYRSTLYRYFKALGSVEVARQNPYKNVSQEDWEWLCDELFSSQKFKDRSDVNSKNRAKVPYNHRAGSKPFACHREKKRRSGEQPSPIQIFYDTHYNVKNGWSNDEARSRYEQMVELKQQSTLEGATPREDDDICNQVLKKKPKSRRNTASTSSSSVSNGELDELRTMVMSQDDKIKCQNEEIQQYKDIVKKMEDDNENFKRMLLSQIGLDVPTGRTSSASPSESN